MAYTNSSLVTYKRISPNKTSPRNHAIDTITIHCIVGQWTAKQGCDFFATTDKDCSANYVVGKDGSIGLSVEEKDRSWCSGNRSNDHRAITIEVASDTTHPYAVTDAALKALIELVADICKRNNIKELKWKGDKSLIGQVDKQNMTVHRWFENKACPGDYLYGKHSYIAEQVNKKLCVSDNKPTSDGLKFKNGDIVNFDGGNQYVSAYAASGSAIKAGKAKVTATCENGKHPYHLRAVNDSGVFVGGGVYGWVDASTVSEIKTASKPAPAPAPTTNVQDKKIDTVKEVQGWANTNYKSGLVVDGIYGANTKKALIKILQMELNQTYKTKLVVDGIWGANTKAACPELNKGDNNDVVRVLQALLVCKGYSEAYVDGDYGNGTYNSVKAYQRSNGLVSDGIAGKNTFAKLCG